MSRSYYSYRTSAYFYLIPILIILIVFAYTFISYQKNTTRSYNTNIKNYNKQTIENNKKGRKLVQEIQKQETASRRGIELPEQEQETQTPPQEQKTTLPEKEGTSNLCALPLAKAKQSSLHQLLKNFGPDKAIDGNKDGSSSSTGICATQSVPGEKSWWMIDLGKEAKHTISKILVHCPPADHPLGCFSNFRIFLVDKDKKIVAEKTFHTDNSPVVSNETWVLDPPVEARGLRIESREPGRPLIISECEIYGISAK